MNAALVAIALLTVGMAIAALTRRNLLHSVLLLAGSWTGVAAFFLWAGAEFVAFAQVLIYVGAISMVVLFAVLLTRRSRDDLAPEPAARGRAFYAVLVGAAVAVVLLAAVGRSSFAAAPPAPVLTVREIGGQLMGPQAASLLVVGLLLTVALLGAVSLAAGNPPTQRKDPP